MVDFLIDCTDDDKELEEEEYFFSSSYQLWSELS